MTYVMNRFSRRMLILVIAPMLLLGACLIAATALKLKQERQARRDNALDLTATNVNAQVRAWGELLRGVALGSNIDLSEMLSQFPEIVSVQLFDAEGQKLQAQRRPGVLSYPDVSLTSNILRAHVRQVGLWIAPIHFQDEGAPRLPYVVALFHQGQPRGFLMVEFQLTSMETAVREGALPMVLLRDRGGRASESLRALNHTGLFLAMNEVSKPRSVLWIVIGLASLLLAFTMVAGLLERRWSRRVADDIAHRERLMTIGATAGAIGHELRTALAVIRNSVEALKPRVDLSDPRTAKHTGSIENQVRLGNRLLSDLLEFARPRSSFLKTENINPLIQDVIASLNLPRSIRIETRLADELPVLSLDADKMRQVLSNLTLNAADAMPDGGTLTVSSRQTGEHVVVELQDTGVGMAPDVRQRLFEPFFSTKARGMGLGMSIVKKIVDAHCGDIHIDSVPGVGTTVVFRLPIPASREPAPSPEVQTIS